MAKTTFTGPVISKKGFIQTGPANVVDADSSISLTVDSHAGKIIHNDAAGAVTYTLPATVANADSGIAGPDADLTNLSNVGAKFTIINSITKTGDLVVQVANATDVITLNGSTTGGVTHARIECTVLASGKYAVEVFTGGTGNLATPFSAAVS